MFDFRVTGVFPHLDFLQSACKVLVLLILCFVPAMVLSVACLHPNISIYNVAKLLF